MNRAFTLLEVLLAVALVAMLAGGVFGFLLNITDRRDRLLAATGEAQAAGVFFEMLEADLAFAIAGDAVHGAGVQGGPSNLRLLSRRVWVPAGAGDRAAAVGDLQLSEYTFEAGGGSLRLRRQSAGSGSGQGSSAETIGTGFEVLRFRYFDGTRWERFFDSKDRGTLPVAVEVAIWNRRGTGGGGVAAPVVAVDDDLLEDDDDTIPLRAPDRIRVISIADGPTTWWKDAR